MSAGSAGRIDLDLGLNYSEFNKQLGSIAGTASGMVGSAFKKLGGVIAAAFAIKSLTDFGKEAINLASDLTEVQNVVDVTFGSMAQDINNWSKNLIGSFGLSELSAKRYSSTLGAMMKSSGLAGVQMEQMSKKLTELTADFASFYNLSQDDAFEKIRSGLVGETDPLMQLGINMTVANLQAYALSQGITKSWQSMTQAEQVLLRYNYLLSVSKDAQGDFARTSNSWANQTRVLTEQWKIFQGTLGAGFINALTPVVRWLNLIIAKLQIAAQYFKAFTEAVFGDASAQSNAASTASVATQSAADSTAALGTAAQDTGKKVKKAGKEVKGSLAGFDQLNTLAKSTADAMDDAADGAGGLAGAGAGGLGDLNLGAPTIDTDPVKKQIEGVVSTIKTGFKTAWDTLQSGWSWTLSTFGPSFKTAWGEIEPVLARWKLSFAQVFSDILTLGEPLKNWILTGLVPTWQQGIELAGHVLAGLLDSVLEVFNSLWGAAFPIIKKLVTDGLPIYTEFLMGAQDILRKLFDVTKSIFDDIWQDAVDPALQMISKIIQDTLDIIFGWWDTWGKKILAGVSTTLEGIKKLWDSLWNGFLSPFINNMLDNISWLWDKHLKGLVEQVGEFAGKLVTAAQDINNKFILPLVTWLVDKLGPTFKNVFSFIGDVIGTALGVISDVAKGIIKSLGGIVDFIAGVFTGDWKKAWNGIKEFFQGIGDALVGIFKGAVNLIIDAFNFLIRQLNQIKVDVPDWFGKIPGIPDNIDSIGFNLPTIPKLAKGGLAYGPTLAMVGDNRGASADPEVISPLSKLEGILGAGQQPMIELLSMILDAIRSDKETVVNLNGTEIARVAINGHNDIARRTGRSPLTGL